MLREIISRCKNVKYCAGNFTQDFGLDFYLYCSIIYQLIKSCKETNLFIKIFKLIKMPIYKMALLNIINSQTLACNH